MTVKTFFPETSQCIKKTENQGKYRHAVMDKGMKEQPVNWFPDSAARLIELLKVNSWNTAVRLLRAEKEEGKADHEDV